MATTEYVLDSLMEMDRFVGLVASATGPAGIADAVNKYLASWSTERILSLQKIDAGWAPFDYRQHPVPVCGTVDVFQICETMRAHCTALKESGITLAPELLELDLFFFFARQIVETHEPAVSSAYAVVPHARHDGSRQSFVNRAISR